MLVTRQEQYKTAAMQAKAAGDLKTATNYLGVSKVTFGTACILAKQLGPVS